MGEITTTKTKLLLNRNEKMTTEMVRMVGNPTILAFAKSKSKR